MFSLIRSVKQRRALAKHTKLGAKDIAQEAMRIASQICVFYEWKFHTRRAMTGKPWKDMAICKPLQYR